MPNIHPERFGVMQGRLSPPQNGLIQSFPWESWEEEFKIAKACGIRNIEWTLDYDGLTDNPIANILLETKIKNLAIKNGVNYKTITGDFLMQKPFWKHAGLEQEKLLNELDYILEAMAKHNSKILVLPLVDNGSCNSVKELDELKIQLLKRKQWLETNGIKVAFETDLSPTEEKDMIHEYPQNTFGINYDIGNSAALGYDIEEQITCIGNRILNVHIKDRVLGGATVPLGEGNADIA